MQGTSELVLTGTPGDRKIQNKKIPECTIHYGRNTMSKQFWKMPKKKIAHISASRVFLFITMINSASMLYQNVTTERGRCVRVIACI